MTVAGSMLLNCPEQSHSPMTVHPQSESPCIQGCRSEMQRTRKDAFISDVRSFNRRVHARAAIRK